WDISKISVKLIQKGGPQYIVSAFFVLGDDYNPNAAPEILVCLNKVGKNSGLYIYYKWIGRSNEHFYSISD
ncbi:MAG: hypothetical protein ACYSRZ_09050, partial [Planctomycetota bacterium]